MLEVEKIVLTPQEEEQWKAYDPDSFNDAVNEKMYDVQTHTLSDLSFLPEELQNGVIGDGPFDILLRPSGGDHSQ
ncbi:hypothetical protein SAMN04487835_10646 [Sharpea azabuensis]|uniref:hypothetical protein n=1 Tax=Sharpea azabuensis TaxID=322505 RepID=UPI0008F0863D|nr:hypothetical protein [Sharpea azabuensis]SFD70740.1 hypothetical protein SAMN04487836_10647 [Sharpea azabuensis]SFK68134.1 hypothetical protein SAMN04487835_10646 [Sharpea azabuensis]